MGNCLKNNYIARAISGASHIAQTIEGTLSSFSTDVSFVKGNYRFTNNSFLTYANMPSLTSVNFYMFSGCGSLNTVNLDKCKIIYDRAFADCFYLSSLYTPECEVICSSAFTRCTFLSSVSFPKCSIIYDNAFYNAAGLSSIYFPSLKSITLSTVFYGTSFHNAQISSSGYVTYSAIDENFLIYVSSASVINCQCTLMTPSVCANNSKLKSINMSKCKIIQNYAFYSCSSLSYANFQACTSVGMNAFAKCINLQLISLPECVSIGASAFSYCLSLSTAYIPKCKFIPNSTFYSCEYLTTVNIQDCSFIGSHAFMYNRRLQSINAPKCTSVYPYAFYACNSLSYVNISSCSLISTYAFYACNSLSYVNISSCTTIGAAAFANCSSLTNISLPSCTWIGQSAFSNCSSLTNISLPMCVSVIAYAFANCTQLSSVYLGDNCTYIGQSVFYNTKFTNDQISESNIACINVSSYKYLIEVSSTLATLTDSTITHANTYVCKSMPLTTIDLQGCTQVCAGAFYGCSLLSSINLPNCKYINDYAFYNCSSLTTINFSSCELVSDYAFASCYSLTSAKFKEQVYLKDCAFGYCSLFSELYLTSPSVCSFDGSWTFRSTKITSYGTTGRIYVRESLVNTYKSAQKWSMYSRIIEKLPFIPIRCDSLTITADDVSGNVSKTTIHYSAYCYGEGEEGFEYQTITGDIKSEDFGQNPSTTESRVITISYTYMGVTATTTITQGPYVEKSYTITTSGFTSYGFTKDTSVLSLDQAVYDGPYKSNNYNINSSYAVAKITFKGYTTFTIWINSYAESTFDYTVAGAIDASTYPTSNTSNAYSGNGYSTSASSSSGKYSNTSSYQKNPSLSLSESYWRKIVYATDESEHSIYITYRKDGSTHANNDRGYFVVVR